MYVEEAATGRPMQKSFHIVAEQRVSEWVWVKVARQLIFFFSMRVVRCL